MLAFGVCAITKFAGKSSINATPVSACALGLSILIVNVEDAPGLTLDVPVVKPTGFPTSNVLLSNALWIVNGVLTDNVSLVG